MAKLQQVPEEATRALVYVGAQPIRWRASGDAPTATAGIYVGAGGYLDFTEPLRDYQDLLAEIEFIRDTTATGDALLDIEYFP